MLSSAKIMAAIALLFMVVGIAPALGDSIVKVPASAVTTAAWAALLYVVGAAAGFVAAGFRRLPDAVLEADRLEACFRAFLALLVIASLYVLAIGPTPPILSAALGESSFDAALMREEALKLSQDRVFVQVYSQTRDIVVPVVFTLALWLLSRPEGRRRPALPLLGIVLAVFIGSWSGQKATVINYLVAALICLAPSVPAMGRWSLRALPLVALLLAVTFLGTTGEFFAATDADLWPVLEAVFDGLVYRIFEGPLEVSAAFVHATENGRMLQPAHVVPGLRWLDPWPNPVENRLGLEYFYTGIDSISANGLAFAYAFVAGGLPGALLGGAATAVVLTCCVRIARASPSRPLALAYEAYLAYLLLDLLNSNFMDYLLKALAIAVLVWAVPQWRSVWPGRALPGPGLG